VRVVSRCSDVRLVAAGHDDRATAVDRLRVVSAGAATRLARRGAVVRRRHRAGVVRGRNVHYVAFVLERLRRHRPVFRVHAVCYTTYHSNVNVSMSIVHLYTQGRIKALRGPRPIPNSSGGYVCTGVGKIGDFRRKSPFIPE